MKTPVYSIVGAFALILTPIAAHSAVKYWDNNGATAGAGGTAPTGTWDVATSTKWNTDPAGTNTTTTFDAGDIAVFSAGTDATGSYTITVSGSPAPSAVTNKNGTVSLAGTALNIGTNTITVKSGATLSIPTSTQISATAGATLVLDGGTMRNTVTGNAGSFVSPSMVITVTTNGGILRFNTADILNIVNSGTPGTIISGPGGITKEGVGVLAIATACTYSGPTIINAGELRIRTSSNRIPTGTPVTVNSPGVLNLNAVSQQIGSLAGTGDVGLAGATLTIGGSTNTSYFGAIKNTANAGAGASTATGGSVTKQGSGVITFYGTNAFTSVLTLSAGGIIVAPSGFLADPTCDVAVDGGTLTLSNATQTVENLYGNGGVIELTTGHTLTINAINTSSARGTNFLGAIVGPGSIIKTGVLTERLLGTNTYSGSTTINEGRIVTSTASTGGGSFTVADSAGLGVALATNTPTLNVSDLTIGTSTMEFDLSGLGYPLVKVMNVNGALNMNGNVTVDVKGINTPGTVTLLEYGSRTGAGVFSLGNLPPRMIGTIDDDTVNKRLVLTTTFGDSLTWVSDASGLWDVNNAGNAIWKLDSNGNPAEYQENSLQGDVVKFDDTATGTTLISLPGTVNPYKVTFNNSTFSYTLTNVGKIAGVASVTKNGTNDLVIGTTNSYTGGTILNAGALRFGNNTPIGTGRLTINGGTLTSDSTTARTVSVPVTLNANVTLGDSVNNGALTSSGAWTVAGSSRQIAVNTIGATISGSIGEDASGRALTKTGDGALILTAANTFTGGFNHNSGAVRVNSTTALGAANSPVSLANGVTLSTSAGTARTLTYSWTVNGDVIVGQTSGGVAAVTFAGTMNLGGATRTFTLVNTNDTISAVITNGGLLFATAGGTLTLSGANVYNGNTTINAGTVSLTGVSSGSGAFTVNTGGTLQVNATATLGNGTGTLNLAGGNVVTTGGRSAVPIPNPVVMTADTTFQGNTTGGGLRDFPFSGSFTTTAGTLTVKNTGTTNGLWNPRFQMGTLNFTQPIVLGVSGDPGGTMITSYNTNGAGDQTFSGVISGYGSVTRSSPVTGAGGRTYLTADNTYTGGTTVTDGTLVVNNTTGSGTGSGAVTVATKGYLIGTGVIGGAVTNSGIISGGNSVGTLTIGGGLTFTSGSTNEWELAANSTASGFDQLVLTGGALTISSNTWLNVKFSGSATFPDISNPFWQTSHSWKVISISGSASNPGLTTFSGIVGANGNNAGVFSTSTDGSGNVYLTFTPGAAARPAFAGGIIGARTTNASFNFSATTGIAYEVQYKNDLNATNWTKLTTVIATNTPVTIVDSSSAAANATNRFYRVIVP